MPASRCKNRAQASLEGAVEERQPEGRADPGIDVGQAGHDPTVQTHPGAEEPPKSEPGPQPRLPAVLGADRGAPLHVDPPVHLAHEIDPFPGPPQQRDPARQDVVLAIPLERERQDAEPEVGEDPEISERFAGEDSSEAFVAAAGERMLA